MTEEGERRTPEDRRRANRLAQLVERERRDDRAGFSGRSGDAVRGRAELGGEHFCGVRVRRRVRAEVEEELEEGEADDEGHRAQFVEVACEDADCGSERSEEVEGNKGEVRAVRRTEERLKEESLDLDPLPTEPLGG